MKKITENFIRASVEKNTIQKYFKRYVLRVGRRITKNEEDSPYARCTVCIRGTYMHERCYNLNFWLYRHHASNLGLFLRTLYLDLLLI